MLTRWLCRLLAIGVTPNGHPKDAITHPREGHPHDHTRRYLWSLICLKLLMWLQIVPLMFFLFYARHQPDPQTRWTEAFLVGGGVAACLWVLLFAGGVRQDRLLCGVNIFLIVGGGAILFQLRPVMDVYESLREAMLFVWVLIVGTLTGLFSSRGFVGVGHPDGKRVRLFSLWLWIAAAVALGVSVWFRGQTHWAGSVPFVGLMLIHRVLAWRLIRVTNPGIGE